jgi:hypothetical protein
MLDDNLLLDLTPREVDVIRMALRTEYDKHKRNDFKALATENEQLRNKINDAILDSRTSLV